MPKHLFIFICTIFIFLGNLKSFCTTITEADIDILNSQFADEYIVNIESATPDLQGHNFKLDLKPFAGKTLKFSGDIMAKSVTPPPVNCGGVKFMVHYVCDDDSQLWPAGCDGKCGTFDWTAFEFSFIVPENIKTAELILGLQYSSGSVQFRNIRAEVLDIYPAVWDVPEDFKCEYDERVTGDIMRRGFMSPFTRNITEKDITDMASWGANLLRWQFMPRDNEVADDLDQYQAYIDEEIALLDRFLPICEANGIKVIIDMHKVPGYRIGTNPVLGTAGADAVKKQTTMASAFKMFFEQKYLDAFIETWRKLAAHFKDNPAVWAYDLCNEPDQQGEVINDYLKCQYLAAKAIREIDRNTPLLIESDKWSSPLTFFYMQPLPFKNIIYQIHMYDPGAYTHQGVYSGMQTDLAYPGEFYGKWYDKEQLGKSMKNARIFQEKYDAVIFVGEFSAIRWAPGAELYMDDVISIFEEYRWPWCYHAFREWDGWDVEYVGPKNSPAKATTDTPRKQVLLKYLRLNQK